MASRADIPAVERAIPAILREIADHGLDNEKARLDAARECLDYLRGAFECYPVRVGDTADRTLERHSLIMQRIVNVLTGNLYRQGPQRTIPDHDDATAWLEAIYKANAVDALLQEGDRLSTAADFAGFQVATTTDPDRPVKIHLWDASQLVVWASPDDARVPIAVAVLDLFDGVRRLRLWTAQWRWQFESDKWSGQTAGGTAYRLVSGPDEHKLGCLPFAFVHFSFPTNDFYSTGPGQNLQLVNEWANYALTKSGDNVRYNLDPTLVGENVREGWRPPPTKPGGYMTVPGSLDAHGSPAPAELRYLQSDASYLSAGWEDLCNFLDHTLEGVGVPKASIRMVQESAKSGVSIEAEQAPLATWAEGRQRPFSYYEIDLARVVLTVGSSHLANNAHPEKGRPDADALATTAATLSAAATVADTLTHRWADMHPEPRGVERDTEDQAALAMGITSRVRILMRREKLTRDEAEQLLKEIAEDRAREAELFAPARPPAAPTETGGKPPATSPADDAEPTDTEDN